MRSLIDIDIAVFIEPAVKKSNHQTASDIISNSREEEIGEDGPEVHAFDRAPIGKEGQREGDKVGDDVFKT